jgi:hypothetical protein
MRLKAVSYTSTVKSWLANSSTPRVLHVFDHACNLINEQKEVLSIVGPGIGNGPFNLVLVDEVLFSEHLSAGSQITILDDQLGIGDVRINTRNSRLWDPVPYWAGLHTEKEKILSTFRSLSIPEHKPSISDTLLTAFSSALVNADSEASITASKKLAGLGNGLTPAGDDFMMGAMHAAYIIHPYETAFSLTNEIATAAAPLTTSLSAAWLRAAGKGETGILWHEFFDQLISASRTDSLARAMHKILSVGETSGADALAGFSHLLANYNK